MENYYELINRLKALAESGVDANTISGFINQLEKEYSKSPAKEPASTDLELIITCPKRNIKATAVIESARLAPMGRIPTKVLAGSNISTQSADKLQLIYIKLREQLVSTGIIKDGVFTRDFVFPSPSAAACVILGRTASGNGELKNKDGESLGVLRKRMARRQFKQRPIAR